MKESGLVRPKAMRKWPRQEKAKEGPKEEEQEAGVGISPASLKGRAVTKYISTEYSRSLMQSIACYSEP